MRDLRALWFVGLWLIVSAGAGAASPETTPGAARTFALATEKSPASANLEVSARSAGRYEARLTLPIPAAAEADTASVPSYHGLLAVGAGQRVSARAAVLARRTAVGLTTAATYPAEPVTLGEPAILHGLRVVPFTIDPRLDRTTVATDLAVTFEFAGSPERPAFVPESFDKLFGSLILNWPELRDGVTVGPGSYVMIMPNNAAVISAVQPLVDWRARQGYNVIAVTTQVAGTTAAQIAAYLRALYALTQPPLEHICLIGDVSGTVGLPTGHEGLSGYNGESDLYYATLDGTDVLPDVNVGRLSVRNLTELNSVVSKVLTYETGPPTLEDPGWFTRATVIGDPNASGITTVYSARWVRAQLERVGYTQCDTIYNDPFASRMYSSCNTGCTVFAYRGFYGVSGFNTGYIDALTNGGELPFAVLPTCGSGSFGSESHSYAEAFLRNTRGGAIGAIGTATTGTHTRYNNCFFAGVWEGAINSGDRHLGAALNRGRIELYNNFHVNEPNAAEIWSAWNNLMGDPATEMWQRLPRTIAVTHPAQLPVGANAVPVMVTYLGAPVAGARVAITQPGNLRNAGYTGADGRVELALPAGAAAGALLVTVSGADLLPYRGSLNLGAVDAFASATDWLLADGQDGVLNPGETGTLTLALTNLGAQLAGAVHASLVAEDPRLTVSAAPVSFGDIAAGATVWGGPFTVQAPADLTASPQALLVTVTSGATTWVSRLEVPFAAARPVVASVSWVLGGPGGDPDPTRRTLHVTLRNDGSRAAAGATVALVSQHRLVLPAGTSEVPIAALAVGQTREANFVVRFDPLAEGQPIGFALAVTTAEGSRHDLTLVVPPAAVTADAPTGPDGYGYLCYDNQDPAPDAPDYDWVELDPAYFGQGTSVGLNDFAYEQDDTRVMPLPFTFRYYGRDYDTLAICSNGWVAFGNTTLRPFHNLSLPSANCPEAMLAVFWDDLHQQGSSRVYYRHDAANGRYIVQWSRMPNDNGGVQNCEVILYDPAVHPTPTGDGLIVMQYDQVNDNDYDRAYSTVGIQSPDHRDGLTYGYFNTYAAGARGLVSGRAIAWVPTPPLGADAFSVWPQQVSLAVPPGEQQQLALTFTAGGTPGTFASYTATAVPNLSLSPATGVVAAGATAAVTLTVDATGLTPGDHDLLLSIPNSAGAPLSLPVHVFVGAATGIDDLPRVVALAPAMPNPFNPRTELSFALPAAGPVRLAIHDLAGRCVARLVDETRSAGTHRVTWDGVADDGARLPSGTYIARLVTGGEVRTTKLTLVK